MSLQLLVPALLDFERVPGRYPLIKREPALLFDQAHTVLLLAAGRAVEGLEAFDLGLAERARRAARFFVRTALLRTEVDHLTLLGLMPDASAEQVREHYRLMIRLTHPDFAGDGDPWPADAAARINIANDVLSSPVKRAAYQASLTPAAAPAPKPAIQKPIPSRPPGVALKPVPMRNGWLARINGGLSVRMKLAIASLGALLSGGALVLLGPTGSETSLAARPKDSSAETSAFRLSAALEEATDSTSLSGRSPVEATAAAPAPIATTRPKPRDPSGTAGSAPPEDSEQVARERTTESAGESSKDLTVAEPPTLLTMRDVHPTLTHVINGLQNGDAEAMAQAIGPEWRQTPANEAFVLQMNQWLAGQRVTQLDKLLFTSRPQGQTLVVDGRVEVSSSDSAQQTRQRELHLRAVFKPQDGRPVLTQLAAGQR
jgi:DnaJ domain